MYYIDIFYVFEKVFMLFKCFLLLRYYNLLINNLDRIESFLSYEYGKYEYVFLLF